MAVGLDEMRTAMIAEMEAATEVRREEDGKPRPAP
ncbi:hypothetical protein COLO4_28327 [Corchorus olitorius]|uniref:Uncharacterized protein n=1 Tax=Corchorus olitorius TaxID=93759 RepID=A0A1R3HLN1_9ROSI|nr:hypothetical protein COLO4_28327 [Corchorus olitorius]